MWGSRRQARQVAALEEAVDLLRAQLAQVQADAAGAAEQADGRHASLEALAEQVARIDERLSVQSDRAGELGTELAALAERIDQIEQRATTMEDGLARTTQDVTEGLERCRTVLARVERQMAFQGEDTARSITGLVERLEELRRRS